VFPIFPFPGVDKKRLCTFLAKPISFDNKGYLISLLTNQKAAVCRVLDSIHAAIHSGGEEGGKTGQLIVLSYFISSIIFLSYRLFSFASFPYLPRYLFCVASLRLRFRHLIVRVLYFSYLLLSWRKFALIELLETSAARDQTFARGLCGL
jgi:hypothetical protein